jgi:hypothetical protein
MYVLVAFYAKLERVGVFSYGHAGGVGIPLGFFLI